MREKLISIITPMYKGSLFVGATIESVLKQTYKNWEMIIVDDASPDEGAGAAVVRSYMDKDIRIRLICANINKGSSGARNEAMRNANGQYFAFLDSDDIWDKDYLSKMMHYIDLNTDEKVVIFFSSYRRMDEDCSNELLPPYMFAGKVTLKQLFQHCPIFPSAAIVDVSKFKKRIFFREELKALRDDYVYWLDIMANDFCAMGYKDILVDYRMRSDSMTASKVKMIIPQWNVYRKVLHMNVFASVYYLLHWGINGLRKYGKIR